MIKTLKYALLLLVIGLTTSSLRLSDNSACLTVKITGITNTRGYIEIGLYKGSRNFPKPGMQYKVKRIKPNSSEVKYKFMGLKPGDYAVCIYHDENKDKKCNRNWIGIPTEAYAFSNNFRPKLSAPDFSDCKFSLKKARMVTIRMVY